MWCAERQIGYGQITVDTVCTYLLFLFENKTPSGKDMSSGALNRIRSSISFFLQYLSCAHENPEHSYVFFYHLVS